MNFSIFGNNLCVIAPHPDDEVLGCGGLISKLTKNKISVNILFVSGHLPPIYSKQTFEKTRREAIKASKIMGVDNLEFLELPATYLHETPLSILNSKIYDFISQNKATSVAIPFPDRHIDHKLIFESSMVVTRPIGQNYPKFIFAYETLSETSWNAPNIEPTFSPEIFVNINEEFGTKKNALKAYTSQIHDNPSRDINAIDALARYRGSQNGYKYAEAFKIIRYLVD